MKKFLIIIFLLISMKIIGVEKPIIKSGINTYGYFKLLEENESIYPASLKDNIFLSFQENFFNIFGLKHKIDFSYSNFNKYDNNLEELRYYIFANTLNLYFKPIKYIQFKLITNPIINYQSGEFFIKLTNKFQFDLSIENFSFKTYYSHLYNDRNENQLFYHSLHYAFYWNFSKLKHIKYKTSISFYFQHYSDNPDKAVSPIKTIRFNFETAVDFNKIDFQEIFDKKEEENDDFFINE